MARRWRGTRNWPRSCAFTSPTRMPPGSAAPTRTPAAPVPTQGHRPVGVLASRTRRHRDPAQQRKTLGFATPDEVFAALVDKATNAVTARNAEGVRYGT